MICKDYATYMCPLLGRRLERTGHSRWSSSRDLARQFKRSDCTFEQGAAVLWNAVPVYHVLRFWCKGSTQTHKLQAARTTMTHGQSKGTDRVSAQRIQSSQEQCLPACGVDIRNKDSTQLTWHAAENARHFCNIKAETSFYNTISDCHTILLTRSH